MVRSLPRVLLGIFLVLGLVLLAALPAGADVYHIKLKSGTVVDTRYQPQDASWDPHMVLLMTEVGNWIGVRKDDIDSVASENATRGFGVTIRNNTISLGVAPNDQPTPNSDKNVAAMDRLTQAIQGLAQGQQQQPYSITQGVQTENTQGIPSAFINPNAGGGGQPLAIPMPVPVPTPTPAPPQ